MAKKSTNKTNNLKRIKFEAATEEELAAIAKYDTSKRPGLMHRRSTASRAISPKNGSEVKPPSHKYTDAEVFEILKRNRGNLSASARALGYHPSTVRKKVSENPAMKSLLDAVRNSVIDDVEQTVVDCALKGDVRAADLYLKGRAKDRGYGTNDINIAGTVNHEHRHQVEQQSIEQLEKMLGIIDIESDNE